jgi:CHC2 zinc finger/Toprim domain
MIIDLARAVRVEAEVACRGGLGLKRFGAELIGPCPQCGGRDRFAVNVRKQVFNCRGCGRSGDVIAFVQHVDAVDFKTAVVTLAGTDRPIATKPMASTTPTAKHDDSDDNSERALAIWCEAVPITNSPAELYLARRGLKWEDRTGRALRFHPRCPFGPDRYPCLVSLYRTISGDDAVAIGRTALAPGGQHIGRKTLGPVMGAAVKLYSDDFVEQGLVIGEGLETTIAGIMLGFAPAWSVGSAGAIRQFPLLGGVDCLTVLVDADEPDRNGRKAGPDAAAECSERWTAAGCEVRRVVPRRSGLDVADLVEARRDR